MIRPCGEQWHLHKHTNTHKCSAQQPQQTDAQKSPLDSSAVQLMHWNLCFYRPSCNLHLRTSYSTLYPTTILILTYAQLIRSSTTQKELSYNVPLKLLKHLNTFRSVWLSNLFLSSVQQTKFCSHKTTGRVASLSAYCYGDVRTHFRSLH